MGGLEAPQLSRFVDIGRPAQVYEEVRELWQHHYGEESTGRLELAFNLTCDLFEGRYPGYRASTAHYHDLRHTVSVLLAAARLLDGYDLGTPMPEKTARNLLTASLLHDSGYIQEEGDTDGTGAKYTRGHEERGVALAGREAERFELAPADVETIARLIRATDLRADFRSLSFDGAQERDAAAVLGTADLLGQMSDREYLERLLFLYYEFREAGVPGYDTEFDILRKTHQFYRTTLARLEKEYRGVYRLAEAHFRERHGIEDNLYMVAIDRQMEYLQLIIDDDTTNFRHKLKRGDQRRLHSSGRI